VISGLSPGQRVVTDGTDRLRDGMKVSIPSAQPASAQAAKQPEP
jgi:membrane fusion protein, multidrug efflux system